MDKTVTKHDTVAHLIAGKPEKTHVDDCRKCEEHARRIAQLRADHVEAKRKDGCWG